MFQSLNDYLPRAVKRLGVNSEVLAAQVVEKFNTLLPTLLNVGFVARDAQAVSFQHGELHIACLSNEAAQELRLRQNEILGLLNVSGTPPEQMVKRFRFEL